MITFEQILTTGLAADFFAEYCHSLQIIAWTVIATNLGIAKYLSGFISINVFGYKFNKYRNDLNFLDAPCNRTIIGQM